MAPRIAVLAPGGVGSVLGGLLTRAGHDVTLVDQWPAHVETMRASGLRVALGGYYDESEADGPLHEPDAVYVVQVKAHHLYEVCTWKGRFDVVFLTSKSYDSKWLARFIQPYLASDGYVVSLQNSTNPEWLVPILGADKVICGILHAGGWLREPGYVWSTKPPDFPRAYNIGELDGSITPRLRELETIMNTARPTKVHTNIRGVMWSKLVHNSMTAPITGLTDKITADVWERPYCQELASRLGQESMAVGKAMGYRLEPIFGLTSEDFAVEPAELAKRIAWASTIEVHPGYRTMVGQDIIRGRPSEVMGYLNGLIVRKGREFGVPTPTHEAVLSVWNRLERGEIRQDASNLDLVASAAKAQTPHRVRT